ncbi:MULTISPECIES: DUF2589 domain-containing protein [unclassified Janthinobacterium]|uniref:DUF2589 domain-containing protein n=1 Tax=unclassified Janthinobacterium TaxID=2610881 RepID=UPI001620246A|nr:MULTISPECIES: DUF2589 domain-containing protein [unclassified Janthinobacterium]MBB5369997.1 hypothetical protein [Janthinobacterium sp. K2C7]MBB5382803.1 hypothetical protein [Janthinobacterium sp. K2Li3]MBB5384788.1 hypothetical protein [Janthinobacterium sp. K2E3]
MAEIIDMASQFKGLPMGDLIGGPLTAACDAQVKLANATADFIKYIGFLPPSENDKNGVGATRLAHFAFTRPVADPADPSKTIEQSVALDVPLLAIVKVPSLSITKVDITFDMEVKSSFSSKETEDKSGKFSADIKAGWGPVSVKVHLEGSVATHKENTRSSDNSAKYHVQVLAEDGGMPEGLARVLDILQTSIQPRIAAPAPAPAPAPNP